MKRGQLFMVSAPSGAGKTSLVKQLRENIANIAVSISHTTRLKRPSEVHGQDYIFVDKAEFESMIAEQAFLEHARVFDNFYGTAQQTVEDQLDKGLDVILEIDWQGARQIRQVMPDSRSVFILPPSLQELEKRLRKRGQDDDEVIANRMANAVGEILHFNEYDYLLINDDFACASQQLRAIFIADRSKTKRVQQQQAQLLASLLNSSKS